MKQKILIADDEPSVRGLAARTLGPQDFEFLTAADGEAACELACRERPDLILLDVAMPRKDGWEALRTLRRDARTRLTPIIMLTGSAASADEIFGLEAGADDYVTKPFVPAELKARVRGAMRRNRLGVSANPLTKLPGSPGLEEETDRRIRYGVPFAFLYVDINHFKPYNDLYGFAAGDRVILETAELLQESLRSQGGGGGFVGHVGGDDFVVITEPERAPHVAQEIAARFDEKAPSFYTAADGARGWVEAEDRRGERRRLPTISLSIGVVTTERRRLDHYAKVVQIASEMKAYCKASTESRLSRFAFDRRSD